MSIIVSNQQAPAASQWAGTATTALRLILGWTYFSAFWRRLILVDKLDPEAAGYIGEKFNHFLPNALGIKPLIEYLVTHPEMLWWAMAVFTIAEGIAGLFMMLGLFTRAMSVVVFGLAMGILLGSGWLGTTCLDEWQIGVLGIASGFTLFLSGGGRYALDHYLTSKFSGWKNGFWCSAAIPLSAKRWSKTVLISSLLLLGITLFTNQYFHGGVWGTLHNKSVRPELKLSEARLDVSGLQFTVMRVEGADVYGSFLIGIQLEDAAGQTVWHLNGAELAQLPEASIDNYYVAKIKPGAHSLVLPLGAKARLRFSNAALQALQPGSYSLILTDISGKQWKQPLEMEVGR